MNTFIDKLKDKALDLGATKIGFSDIESIVPKEFSHLKYGITVMVRLSDEIVNQIETMPTFTYFHHYRDINTLIDQICLRLSLMIQEQGFLAMNVPASQTITDAKQEKYRAIFSHKVAAIYSGLGWIGKNGLLITEDFGPRVRLGTILTNLPIKSEKWDVGIEKIESKCGNCRLCVNSCPAKVIKGENWTINSMRDDLLDVDKCAKHMRTAYKDIGRGSVCGLCIKACPKGAKLISG